MKKLLFGFVVTIALRYVSYIGKEKSTTFNRSPDIVTPPNSDTISWNSTNHVMKFGGPEMHKRELGSAIFYQYQPLITVVQLRKYKLCTVLSIWRTLQSVNGFCGRLFGSVASNLHLMLIFCKYEMFTMVRCHLSVILFIQLFQLSPRLFERRARYWPLRNINSK